MTETHGNYGELLTKMRRNAGLSQTKASVAIGISQSYLSCIENRAGKPQHRLLAKMQEVYGQKIMLTIVPDSAVQE